MCIISKYTNTLYKYYYIELNLYILTCVDYVFKR
nr:MAG TPA: hypothetical protein [Caudoviricetes sp.]